MMIDLLYLSVSSGSSVMLYKYHADRSSRKRDSVFMGLIRISLSKGLSALPTAFYAVLSNGDLLREFRMYVFLIIEIVELESFQTA